MPMHALPELGVGIVYLSGLDQLIRDHIDLIDVIELEPQTTWYRDPSGMDRFIYDEAVVAGLASLEKPILFHGVGFPVGGTIPPDRSQVPTLGRMMEVLKPCWMSEHLSFNLVNDKMGHQFNAGFLLPPCSSLAGVEVAVRSIQAMQSDLGMPIAIETGVNYLKPRKWELSDGEFVARVSERADCHILLDIHNIYANEQNGRQSVHDFLKEIPLDRVIEIHLAGGFTHRGYYLDAHSGVSTDELLTLTEHLVPRLPNLRAIIFEVLPEFAGRLPVVQFRDQLFKMREIWEKRSSGVTDDVREKSQGRELEKNKITPAKWEYTLGSLVAGREVDSRLAADLKSDDGLDIIKELCFHFRASAIISILPLSTRLLRLSHGSKYLVTLLHEYMHAHYPRMFGYEEAEQFSRYLRGQNLKIQYLEGILAYEEAFIKAAMDGKVRLVQCEFNSSPVLKALESGELPTNIPAAPHSEIVINPRIDTIQGGVLSKLRAVYHN